jgi:hypothetical protein
MLMVGNVLRGMADAAAGTNPEVVAAALQRQAMDFVFVISDTRLAQRPPRPKRLPAAKTAARGQNGCPRPESHRCARRGEGSGPRCNCPVRYCLAAL